MPYTFEQPIVISRGNTKIGPIPNVSLPPIVSCQKNIPCAKKGCYSLKAMCRFKTVRDARMHNWDVLTKDFDRFFQDIANFIIDKKPKYFRWHVDGDVPSQRYLDKMIDLANEYPVRMLTFTKNYSLDLTRVPKNLSIIPSMWPHLEAPRKFDRPIAWMYDHKDTDHRLTGNYFVCHGKCISCLSCWHIDALEKDVIFYKH